LSKSITFIADFFLDEIFGGAELVNEEIIKELENLGYQVNRVKCSTVTNEHLTENIFISNFVQLSENIKLKLQECNYCIIEHDHKYIPQRDASKYKDYMVPPNQIINRKFYTNAKYVYCQSRLHSDVVSKNVGLNNVVNLSTSIWSDEHLDIIKKSICEKTISKTMILNSPNPIKNTNVCIQYCETNNIEYDLVGPLPYKDLMETMAKYETVLFLPGVLETYNKFIVEARMLGCKVITDDKNGCTSEPWFPKLKGIELLDFIRASKQSFIENFIQEPKLYEHALPLVSIITSKFKGEDHIKAFLENMTSQSVFSSCELIIVDPTPGPLCETILSQMKIHDNIIYKKLEDDPGIYGCWNKGIELSKGKYITNANLDDRRADTHIEHHVRFLEDNENIDLAYSEAYLTMNDFESYYNNTSQGRVYPIKEFSIRNMEKCLPGCMPVWRAEIHEKEMFDDSYKSAGDWEMWLRMVKNGSVFSKIPGIYGMYYMNPKGMSTSLETQKEKHIEESLVFNNYKHIFGKG